MSGVAAAQPSRRLAAIMFTDLVGYSALAHRDEALAIELLELHRSWVREILPQHAGVEIETVGDAFLVEFAGALAAVECALAIQQRFTDHNSTAPESRRMQLRIGIHLGDIEHKDGKVMGDGVNIASRIHGMAEPGGICVSETAYHVIRNRAGLQFVSLGTPGLKNISTTLELFRVLPAGARGLRFARAAALGRRYALPVALVVAGLVLAVATWKLAPRQTETPSLAVLPFVNLSADKDNEYFAGGLHESLLTMLAGVSDLKLISRTSVMEYKDAARNLPDIAEQLGVRHILEGSVQKSADQIRVTVQLIDARTDKHLWAESYDRKAQDVFALQSELAGRIVESLRSRLAPVERSNIETTPTTNAEAYDLYLNALALSRDDGLTREHLLRQEALLKRAIEIDPTFALGHARFGSVQMLLFWRGRDASVERRNAARAAAERALALNPRLADAHYAMGLYHYYGFHDYAAALDELEQARQAAPNNSDIHAMTAYVQRRRGEWDEALAGLARAIELDPRNLEPLEDLAQTYERLRRYREADLQYARAESLAPDRVDLRLRRALLQLRWRGTIEPLRKATREIKPDADPKNVLLDAQLKVALYEDRGADVLPLAEAYTRPYWYRTDGVPLNKELVILEICLSLRSADEVRACVGRHRAAIERALASFRLYRLGPMTESVVLAVVNAVLGQRDDAVRQRQEAQAALSQAPDAVDAVVYYFWSAQARMWLGDFDGALDDLEQMLEMPWGSHAYEVRAYVAWRQLRSHPRFQKLIADHLPKDQGAS